MIDQRQSSCPCDVIVVGGSIAGLLAALALKAKGFHVTIVERDPSPDMAIKPETSEMWKRRGAPHSLQPHALLPSLRNLLVAHYPALAEELVAAGVYQQRFPSCINPLVKPKYKPQAGDDDMIMLMSRRTTLELVLRRHVERNRIADAFIHAKVTSLVTTTDADGTVTVLGIRADQDGREITLSAPVVIDSSGRASRFAEQLRRLGAAIDDEHYESNVAYFSRSYRLKPGCEFPPNAAEISRHPDMTITALEGDNGTLMAVAAVFKDDTLLYPALGDTDLFEQVARSVPAVADWIHPDRVAPDGRLSRWDNMDALWRHMVRDGRPQVLGLFFLGDTAMRSNPRYGRGCTWAMRQSILLADILCDTESQQERALRYDAALQEHFRNEWEYLLKTDREEHQRFRAFAGLPASLSESRLKRFLDALIERANYTDPTVRRAILRGGYGFTEINAWKKSLRIWARILRASVLIGKERLLATRVRARLTRDQIGTLIQAPARHH